ncbi:hypothetical protein PYW07_016455 [Mythimna separata]|uniref:Uncharacterized protein n=1 Tax=Mythimna separata TaxID=271217 RepID=A0AAD7YKJ9_MYTSE|nr:hypothetical protein PYW07_016455 [Mythimna separata]
MRAIHIFQSMYGSLECIHKKMRSENVRLRTPHHHYHHLIRNTSTAGYRPPPSVATTTGPVRLASIGFPRPPTSRRFTLCNAAYVAAAPEPFVSIDDRLHNIIIFIS